jgi:triacylglycerol lipase
MQARHLGEVADRLRKDTGTASVDVIGYSAGGVVARLWVRDDGGAGIARRVLTLGSPHHGTTEAALGAELAGGCPEACEQLVPDSDLLRQLNAGDETPAGPVWATIRSTSDQVVTPVNSATLTGALNIEVQDICPRSTAAHGELPRNPVVLGALTSVLGVAAAHPPTNVRC